MPKLLLVFFFCLLVGLNCFSQQVNFIQPNQSTPSDELLENVLELPNGSLVFCGSQLASTSATTFTSSGVLIKTDRLGRVLTKKVLPQFGSSSIDFTQEALYVKGGITLVGIQNTTSNSSFTGYNRVNWRRLDTSLNVLKERIIELDTAETDILALSITQVQDTTYIAGLLQDNRNFFKAVLMTLNDTGGVIAHKKLDSTFFGYPGLRAEAAIAKGIELKPSADNGGDGSVTIACSGLIDDGTGQVTGAKPFIINVNAHLNLLDTINITPYVGSILGDTSLNYSAWETIPLLNNKYIAGSSFFAPDPNQPQQSSALLGISKFDRNTHTHKLRSLVPPQNNYDDGTLGISGRSLAKSNQHFYAFSNTWDGGGNLSEGPESQWVLARFDTNANMNKTFILGDPDYRYLARHIEPLRDGGVMLLGTRENFVQYSNIPQRDYFAIRLDSAGNPLSVPTIISGPAGRERFRVSPNPGNGLFEVTDTKGALAEISVSNVQGQLLYRQKAKGNTATVSITGQPAGAYLLQVRTTDGATEALRLLVQE